MQSHVHVGESFFEELNLSEQDISTFARSFGDLNPLHHDQNYALNTRFRGIIASGPHITGLMMGMTASYFSRSTAMLGLEFGFSFLKPIRANETIRLEWLVLESTQKPSLFGELVKLRGQALNPLGEVCVSVWATVLVTESL
jgi:3-hydroxybutyryl-CoA dehydratase